MEREMRDRKVVARSHAGVGACAGRRLLGVVASVGDPRLEK
jgi:hypothetical protein